MSAPRIQLSQQVIRFAGVGLVSTALHLGLFVALVGGGLGSQLANVLSTAARFVAMRSWIFTERAPEAPTTASGPTDRHEPAYGDDGVLDGVRQRD